MVNKPEDVKIVLVVEDDSLFSNLYRDALSAAGYGVIIARNGEEGEEAAKEHHPNLILLDLVLPKESGMEVLQKIRDMEWGKTVPVIILTNVDPDDSLLRGVIEYHPAYYLNKTKVNPKDVLEKVSELLA